MTVSPDSVLHTNVADRLAAANQRYPQTRRRLVDALHDADKPLSVPEILDALGGDVPQSSIYRNLDHLAEAGVVQRIAGDDNGRFELAEELSGHHHHHLVCSNCGTVYDIAASSRLERALEEASLAAEEGSGFAVTDHRIELVGICQDCRG